jgi:hypothetical protein
MSVTECLQVLTYLLSLAVWQKSHVVLDMELDVKLEGDLIFGRNF